MKGPRFSFREWAKDEDSEAWVFITVRDDMKATLKPLITMMIESALSAILTLEPDEQRLIGVSVDEIGTLHEIPTFDDFISTCRKFGGMPIIGFQSNSQLDAIYGEKKSTVLMDSMGTLAAFRINGGVGAKWLAEQMGDREKEEALENTSFGANDMRDATNVNRSNKEQNIVMRSMINALDNRNFYLKLGRGLPVAMVESPYVKMPIPIQGSLKTTTSQMIRRNAFSQVKMKSPQKQLLRKLTGTYTHNPKTALYQKIRISLLQRRRWMPYLSR